MGYPLPLRIMGIGCSLPSRVVESIEIDKKYGLEPGWCEQKHGIAKRYWVTNETATSLGTEAALKAIFEAGLKSEDIDLLISASSAVDSFIPSQDVIFKRALGLKNDMPTMTLSTGCLNAINVLDLAANYIASGIYSHILIICATVSSRGLKINDSPEEVSLLADGAAAVVVGRTDNMEGSCLLAAYSETYATDISAQSMAAAGDSVLLSKNARPEDLEYSMEPKHMQSAGAKYNFSFLKSLYPISDKTIDWVIPNQSSKLARDMMRLMFRKEKILSVIYDYGNMGPVGYYMSLFYGYKEGKIKRGDTILMNGIGAGISLSGIVLRF